MAITTGKFFSCILVGITPTSLGVALDALGAFDPANPPTPDTWRNALTAAVTADPTLEEPQVVNELQALLKANPETFAALLKPVFVSDGNGGFSPTPIAKVLRDLIFEVGNKGGFLTVPWGAPPHPFGGDVSRLLNLLSPFDEEQ